jgi:hypothetical protein
LSWSFRDMRQHGNAPHVERQVLDGSVTNSHEKSWCTATADWGRHQSCCSEVFAHLPGPGSPGLWLSHESHL